MLKVASVLSRAVTGLMLATLLCGSPSASARPVTLGVKGGFVSATFRNRIPELPWFEFGSRQGLTGGIFAIYPASGQIAIQTEAMYVMRGASLGKSTATDADGNVIGTLESTWARDDLALGVLARVTPMQGARISPYFLLGPTLMRELKEEMVSTGVVESSTSVDGLKSAEFTLALGAGAETALGAGRLLLEVRYDHGLSNISRDVESKQHTSTWRVMTGYAF